MNKAFVTNLIAAMLVIAGFVSPIYGEHILSIGLFALSGAITNWLAIYMLFERVPLLYGSGVIPSRFEAFKASIKQMVMEQFFNQDALKRFIAQEEDAVGDWFSPKHLLNAINYDGLFQKLVDAIMESSFGTMLNMFGGPSVLEKLRQPVIDKIRQSLVEMTEKETFKSALAASIDADKLSEDMQERIENIVDRRLNELTPELVKELVQRIIREHLGWLVVWGGVFGGIIGLLASFI